MKVSTRAESTKGSLQTLTTGIARRHPGYSACAAFIDVSDGSLEGLFVEESVSGKRQNTPDASDATPNDAVHLGSLTKAMTATLIGLFIDRNLLCWQTTLDQVFGSRFSIHRSLKDVTVQDLVVHTSGFTTTPHQEVSTLGWDLQDSHLMPKEQRVVALSLTLASPLSGFRGRYMYSNTNYIVLGAMLEAVDPDERCFEDILKGEVFTPLGIRTAGFGMPGREEEDIVRRKQFIWGHGQDGKPMDPKDTLSDNPDIFASAGKVHMTVRDYCKFLAIHASFSCAEKYLGLSRENWEKLHTPTSHSQGYTGGWIRSEEGVLMHDGSNTMNFALSLVVPEKNVAIVLATNHMSSVVEQEFTSSLLMELFKRGYVTNVTLPKARKSCCLLM